MVDKVEVLTRKTWAKYNTGGPKEPKWLEHALGWTLVVVLAMLVTQMGLL